jgi:hypothetical protein
LLLLSFLLCCCCLSMAHLSAALSCL